MVNKRGKKSDIYVHMWLKKLILETKFMDYAKITFEFKTLFFVRFLTVLNHFYFRKVLNLG